MTQMKATPLGLLYLVLVIFLAAGPAHAQTAQEVAKKAFRSTVLLVMEDANGQPLSLGSGFFVRDGEIASNLHVLAGAARGYAKVVNEKTKFDIEGITAVDAERDLVVLKISSGRLQEISLGNSDGVQVGDSVYAVGNPQGLEGTFSQGIVSSIREVGTDRLFQITAPISPGSSGGPVLNGNGEVIGVSVATFSGGQNLNFAIPSNYLKVMLARAGAPKPLSREKAQKAHRSILSGLGGRNSEGVVGGQLAWNMPQNQFSGSYSFSLRNKLKENVRNVHCLIVFRGLNGVPIDIDIVRYTGLIPPGLAKRTSSEVHPSIGVLTKWRDTAAEFRILDFEIVP